MRAGIQKPCISHTQWDPECANCYVMPMKILQSPREQFAKVDSIVRAIKYKPGYALEVVVPQMFSNYSWGMDCEFHLNVSVDDATKAPPEKIRLTLTVPFILEQIASLPESDIIRFVFNNVILKWETHEAQEWFRYRGELVDDPHAEERLQHAREVARMIPLESITV